MILVTGFGPFRTVQENPSAALARALHGQRVGDELIVAHVLPVSFARGPQMAVAMARTLRPSLILGFGVSRRVRTEVECIGRNRVGSGPDVDGEAPPDLGPGPATLDATLPVHRLARALDASVSEDAGSYVCNAWLYTVLRDVPKIPSTFVHIPPSGHSAASVLFALGQHVTGE